jgi:hypothetical protein
MGMEQSCKDHSVPGDKDRHIQQSDSGNAAKDARDRYRWLETGVERK